MGKIVRGTLILLNITAEKEWKKAHATYILPDNNDHNWSDNPEVEETGQDILYNTVLLIVTKICFQSLAMLDNMLSLLEWL